MLKFISSTNLDNEKLSKVNFLREERLNEFDFSKAVVRKPWGHEYLAYKDEGTSVWILHIKKDYATSMHCHVNKKTALIVLSGKVCCSTLDRNFELGEGDGLILDKKVFHSTKAISSKEAILAEVENPSRKEDLVRLQDSYGRELKGYELQNEMCFDLSNYERIFFNRGDKENHKRIGNMDFCVKFLKDNEDVRNYLRIHSNSISIILSGEVSDTEQNIKLTAGDLLRIEKPKDTKNIVIQNPIKILNIRKSILDFD